MMKKAVTLSMAGLLGACASVPDVTYHYYLAKSDTVVTVTQTLTCSSKTQKDPIVSYGTPTVTTTFSADFTRDPLPISASALNSAFADNTFSTTFTNDGRLKTVNGSSTGQGQTILQSLITVGTTVASLGGAKKPAVKSKVSTPCSVITQDAPDGKSMTFTYSNARDPVDLGDRTVKTDIALKTPLGTNESDFAGDLAKLNPSYVLGSEIKLHLTSQMPTVTARPTDDGKLITYDQNKHYAAFVTVQKIANVSYDIEANGTIVGYGHVTVPRTHGGDDDTYQVPITGATFFGTQSFTMTPSDDGSGGIGTATYGANAGTAASNVITVINAGLTAAKPSN
ncbi:MAG TPA: hypothetical protein VG387_17730 [Rhizomicrobium sp.]|jgi:hypothetical protein|nr:hypothetical protein [Rhizomicrobium sp.]